MLNCIFAEIIKDNSPKLFEVFSEIARNNRAFDFEEIEYDKIYKNENKQCDYYQNN